MTLPNLNFKQFAKITVRNPVTLILLCMKLFGILKEITRWQRVGSRYITCLLALMLTAGFLRPVHATTEQWRWMEVPRSSGASPGALWGSAANNLFGVGNYGETVHYDGEQWTALKFPSGAPSGLMRDVWGSDENNVFAAGANGLLLKYIPDKANESDPDWEVMENPQENYPGYPYGPQHLYGVWGSSGNNVFAVGADGTILHYNGMAWSVVQQLERYTLTAIWGSDASNIFAVGRGVILHSPDGIIWEDITPPRPNPKNHGEIIKFGDYRDVWGNNANNIFVVGDDTAWEVGDNFREELILHSSDGGGSWHRMTLPATRPYCDLCDRQTDCGGICDNSNAFGIRSVWGTSANNVYAVGYQGTFLHYDGVAWSYVWDGIDPPDYRHTWLDGLWGSDENHMFFCGGSGVYTNAQNQPVEPLCNGIDDDGNGIIDDGCYACQAGDFFQIGERQYCFDFGNRPESYAEAETICDLYDADLASYGGEDDTEIRNNIINIIAIHRSLWPRNLFGTLHGAPAGGNIILDECSALNEDYPDDPEIFGDPAKPGGHDHCSASVLAHFAYEPFGEPLAGLLEDGGFGDAFGVTCERAIPDGLLLHYKFTQSVGGDKAIDGSGNHNHGDIIDAQWIKHGNDYALEFEDIINDYVQFTPPGPLAEGTVAAWVMQESFQEMGWSFLTFSPVPLGGRDNAVIFGVHAEHTAPYVGFGIDPNGPDGWKYAVSSTELQPNTWYHLAASWGPNGMRVYVNGRLEGENPYTGPLPDGSKYAYLAAETWHPYFDGIIDDVRIYSRALEEAEVQFLYDGSFR